MLYDVWCAVYTYVQAGSWRRGAHDTPFKTKQDQHSAALVCMRVYMCAHNFHWCVSVTGSCVTGMYASLVCMRHCCVSAMVCIRRWCVYVLLLCVCVTGANLSPVCMSLTRMLTPSAGTGVLCVLTTLLVLHVPFTHRVTRNRPVCVCLHYAYCIAPCACSAAPTPAYVGSS